MNKPIRVLHALPDLAMGGGQQLVLNLARAMHPQVETEVAFFAGDEHMRSQFEAIGVPVHELPARKALSWLRAGWTMWTIVRRRRIDVLHAHSSQDKRVTQIVGLVARRPVVAHLHVRREHAHRDGGLRGRARSWTRRLVGLATVSCYIAISNAVMDVNRSMILRPATRLVMIPNGIPIEPYQGAVPTSRSSLGLPDDVPVLLWAGRLSAEKDVPSLMAAMTHLREAHPDVRLLLAGDGPKREELEALRTELALSDSVLLLGRRQDVPGLMAMADLFVFASVAEGFGLAVAEAQAAGLPVIAFRIPALAEIVDDGRTGLLVDGRSPGDMAQAIAGLLTDPTKRRSMSEAARRRAAETLDIAVTASAMTRVYARSVGRARE